MLHPSFSQIRRARSSPDLCSKRLGCWTRPEVRWTTTSVLRHLIDHLDAHVLLKGGLYPNQPATFHQSNCNQLIPVYHQASNSQMYYQSTFKLARLQRLSSISYNSSKQSRVATSLNTTCSILQSTFAALFIHSLELSKVPVPAQSKEAVLGTPTCAQ